MLCCGEQIVLPSTLRQRIIQAVHNDTHAGINATRNKLRSQCWWPGNCSDVEHYVSNCETCCKIKRKRESAVHTWPSEAKAWTGGHMDHAFTFNFSGFVFWLG